MERAQLESVWHEACGGGDRGQCAEAADRPQEGGMTDCGRSDSVQRNKDAEPTGDSEQPLPPGAAPTHPAVCRALKRPNAIADYSVAFYEDYRE